MDVLLRKLIVDSGITLTVQRKGVTTGSVWFFLWVRIPQKNTLVATIEVRMITLEQTYVAASYPGLRSEVSSEEPKGMDNLLSAMVNTIYTEQEAMQVIAAANSKRPREPLMPEEFVANLAKLLPTPEEQKLGRPVVQHNEWARQELAAGRDRGAVLRGYLDRIGTDPTDEEAVEKGKDRFRKAIRRTKRT